ncbi:Fosmidomycin resistance protein [Gordoniibacillus kamchatkensis]|uniref:Fosmidomycin resistance protein n=1 Tax=Gordoniibacillus kamchatkensis TaxID=1590651 RepID=A0ABR5ACX7_9BACL|nr:MFS transporter [Paenibacillus sp. VKM B-2647]KIL38752.1 Fosmidomycin resistance protein [Paenibacillus sp. VKM B-2647]
MTPPSGSAAAAGVPSRPLPSGSMKQTVYRILLSISLVHLLNDSIQSVIPAIFPILKNSMHLSYTQIGWISFAINFTASIMQPVVGMYTDRKPSPYMLPLGMASTLLGMLSLAFAPNYWTVLLSVVFVGLGSAAFHPEGSRVARMAAGPRRGLAQSIFQVGGNFGQSLAPIFTKLIFIPLGQFGAIWFTAVAGLAIMVQMYIASWYKGILAVTERTVKSADARSIDPERSSKVRFAIIVLILLVFCRSWYGAAIGSYYQFYLQHHYGISLERAQDFIFLFAVAGAVSTFFGGALADRFGRKNVIWFSMLGSAPLAILLPFVSLGWAYVLLVLIGVIILSSFSVTVVYAQELFPGKVGTVSGLIVGLAFGLGGVGALALGNLIDKFGLDTIMIVCGFLPLLGVLTFLLPSDKKIREWTKEA